MRRRYVLLLVMALLCCATPAMAREVFYYNNLDTDPGWTTEGQWAFGSQDDCCGGEPHSGTGMYMHGPEVYYEPNMDLEALTSAPIDCTGKHGVALTFAYAKRVCNNDQGSVQVSNNGDDWVTIWSFGCGSDDWQTADFDISEVADDQATVYLRWILGPTDGAGESWGMRIDDVFLTWESPNPALEVLLWTEWSDDQIVDGNITGILYTGIGNVFVTESTAESAESLQDDLDGKQVLVLPMAWSSGEPDAPAPGAVGIGENGCLENCAENVAEVIQDFASQGGTVVVTGEAYGLSGFLTAAGLMEVEWAGAYTTGSPLTPLLPDHPLLADVTPPILSQAVTNSYLVGGGALPVLADPFANTVVACRQLGRGGVVALGYNYETYDDNAAQILVNSVLWPRSELNVLLYDHDSVNHVGAEALGQLHIPYGTANADSFDTALASQSWDLVVVDAPGTAPASWAGLTDYVAAGGRVIISTPDLKADFVLAEAFGVTAVAQLELLPTVYPTGPGFALFDGVPDLSGWGDNWPTPGGWTLGLTDPSAGVFALYDISPTAPALAALVLGNAGRTFANGFTWDDRDQDADDDTVQDTVELVMNEILYLLTAGSTDFIASPTVGLPPLEVQFADVSMCAPIAWLWDFGDGATSEDQHPTHTYADVGDYTVTLTVLGVYGEESQTKTDYIHVQWEPAADFSATPLYGAAPLNVSFTDQSSEGCTSWNWDFGDGGAATTQNPSHQYHGVGEYTVGLTVENYVGADTEVKANYIVVLPLTPVTAFIADPTAGPAPLAVTFADISTNSPTSWSWDFGDAGVSTLQNPSHTYTTHGCYTVSLTVQNAGGSDTATREDYIVVSFQDIPKTYWAFDEVMACYLAGVALGYGDGLFHSDVVVTRAQMAAFIARAMAGGDGNVPTGPGTATFPDVPTGYWAYDYIEYAYAQDVVLGYWDGYHPEEDVDRGQMAVFIARAMCGGDDGVPTDDGTPTFPDVTIDGLWSWAYDHVEYIAGEGVTNGYPDGNYHPEFDVSRDQMAVFIQRAFGLPIPGT